MSDKDKILAKDLIKISGVSELLTGDRFALRLDRSFGKHEGSVNRLFDIVQEWIDSDKSFVQENTIGISDFVGKPSVLNISKTVHEMPEREFKIKAVEVIPESRELRKDAKTDYEYQYTFPLGSKAIEIIGHKVFKHHAEEIFYIKLPHGKEFKYAILHSEKEVKDFIRKEIVK